MASVSKKGKFIYEENDPIDYSLVGQIAKHIKHDKLGLFVKHLGLPEEEYQITSNTTTNEEINSTLGLWWKQHGYGSSYTVKRFVNEITLWEEMGFVDSNIWESLRPYTNVTSKNYKDNQDWTNQIKEKRHKVQSFPQELVCNSDLGENGSLVSDLIDHQGWNPPLRSIELMNYSMPNYKWIELLQFLKICNYLTTIRLTGIVSGELGFHLAHSIRSWGDDSLLQALSLNSCSIPEAIWPELFQSLSGCKHLRELHLNQNTVSDSGYHLAHVIRSWGKDPPLQLLDMRNCSLPEQVCAEILQTLATCRNLTYLDLTDNSLGDSGYHLADVLRSWGNNPPLQHLYLMNCSLPEQVCADVLQSLVNCSNLTYLDVPDNSLGESGYHLAHVIRSWGSNPPLQFLNLRNCSLPEHVCADVLQSLATCRNLKYLSISNNTFGKSGYHLAHVIRSWGNDPPLQELYLRNCSLPEQVCAEILQPLATCRHLKYLSISNNSLGKSGHLLAHVIRSWGNDPPLQLSDLRNCSLPEQVCAEILQTLATCRNLTYLDLTDNSLGESGYHLAQVIRSWGNNPPLQHLYLMNCALPEKVCAEVLLSLTTCGNLTHLNLGNNTLGDSGRYLAESIRSWGDDPRLKIISLEMIAIQEDVWVELLKVLSNCKNLTYIDLSSNVLTGCLLFLMAHAGLPSLQTLGLNSTRLNKSDVNHLTNLVQKQMLSGLRNLHLEGNNWLEMQEELIKLKNACDKQMGLTLHLGINTIAASVPPAKLTETDSEQKIKKKSLEYTQGESGMSYQIEQTTGSMEQELKPNVHDDVSSQVINLEHRISNQQKSVGSVEIYYELDSPKSGNTFSSGTFHQLLAECSKIKTWKFCERKHHISPTEALFELTTELMLVVLMKNDLLRVSICSSQKFLKQDIFQLVTFSRDIRHLLSPKMEKVGIAQTDTFHSLCPYSKPTDTIPCLVQVKEYEHPTPNTFSYWCVKKKCDLHQRILQHTAVPSLLMLSLDAGGKNALEAVQHKLYHPNRKQTFPITINKNKKEYMTTVTSGASCIIQDPESNISIEVVKGPKTVVSQYIHTDLETIGYATPNNECIVSPVVSVQTCEISNQCLMSDEDAPMVGDSNKQPVGFELLYSPDIRKSDHQALNRELLAAKKEVDYDGQSMRPEALFTEAEADSADKLIKLEPLSPTMDTDSDDKPMKHEPFFPEKVEDHDGSMTLNTGCPDDEPVKHEFLKAENYNAPMHQQESIPVNIDEQSVYRFRLTIPHYIKNEDLVPSIQVKFGNILGKLSKIRKGKPIDKFEPYYDVFETHVKIYAHHFCDVVCTCPEKVCASKLLVFPFGQIDSESKRMTYSKVKTYLCNHLYQDKSLKKELKAEAAEFGLKLLEQFFVPLNPAIDIGNCGATICLKVTDSDHWGPSSPDDDPWDAERKQLTETTRLSDMMHIVDGHLCKSKHFDAANFGLKASGVVDVFHGKMTVTMSNIQGRPRNVHIRIPPSQAKEPTIQDDVTVQLAKTKDQKELTDGMVVKLSKQINEPMDLLMLGTLGLSMKEEELARHLHNKKDNINMAAYGVFKIWKASQPDRTVAYENLCKALRHKDVGMESLIKEVLQ